MSLILRAILQSVCHDSHLTTKVTETQKRLSTCLICTQLEMKLEFEYVILKAYAYSIITTLLPRLLINELMLKG